MDLEKRLIAFLWPNRSKKYFTILLLLVWVAATSNLPAVCFPDSTGKGCAYYVQYIGLPILWFILGGEIPLYPSILEGADIPFQRGILLSPLWVVDVTLWYNVSCLIVFLTKSKANPPVSGTSQKI